MLPGANRLPNTPKPTAQSGGNWPRNASWRRNRKQGDKLRAKGNNTRNTYV
jgi:hypothetical protein